MTSDSADVVIIGAGPYGLSVASHLADRGIGYRLFGTPMHTWRHHMPEGMWLRSEGFASNLSDPHDAFSLARFCGDHGYDVGGWGVPVPLEVYCEYGEWFVEQTKVCVEDTHVLQLSRAGRGFVLDLADGDSVAARQVVVAVGLTHFRHVPAALTGLPSELCAHSSSVRGGIGTSGVAGEQLQPSTFAGREVVVIGAGQSALENAALMHEHGAHVRVVARGGSVTWNPLPHPLDRPTWQQLRRPVGGLCTGMRCWMAEHGPLAFHALPNRTRLHLATSSFGPSGAWWLRDRIEGKVQILYGHETRSARVEGSQVSLELAVDGERREIRADQVISATGYRVDLDRIPFLDADLRASLRSEGAFPALTRHFEASVPNLYFVGAAAAASFGPVARFVLGARFTARTVTRQLAARSRRTHATPAARPPTTRSDSLRTS
ncbi:FAD-dependent oxidoreductase [Nocardioides xinjiangensis]|uniref:FAD-dependent oxidoreductase n=1 Tax=Nocardioides xinjiangensis TaxID=2817376 RepID=UPI001B3016B8|nr:FAD-dependent oxidoreductase [Nocardioides sp. SYSU D00514]